MPLCDCPKAILMDISEILSPILDSFVDELRKFLSSQSRVHIGHTREFHHHTTDLLDQLAASGMHDSTHMWELLDQHLSTVSGWLGEFKTGVYDSTSDEFWSGVHKVVSNGLDKEPGNRIV